MTHDPGDEDQRVTYRKCEECASPYGWWEYPTDLHAMFQGECPRCWVFARIEEMAPPPKPSTEHRMIHMPAWEVDLLRRDFQRRREAAVYRVMPMLAAVERVCRQVFLAPVQRATKVNRG